jgi:hypothetical protein
MSTCQRPQKTQKGQSGRESKHLPPSLVVANLRQPGRVQANGSADKVDGRVSTVTDITRLHCVNLRGRHVAQEPQLTGFSPNLF